MTVIRLIKPGLFLYECFRIMSLAALLVLQESSHSLLTKMLMGTPGALFPLMALFIWLDTERYRAYLPLFTAGKCIGIFVLLGWSIVSQRVTMIGSLVAELFLLSGDLLALAAVLLISKDLKKTTEISKPAEVADEMSYGG